MAFVTREFLNITNTQQVEDMSTFINANKPESLSSVNVYADTTNGTWWFLVFNLYTAISNNGRIDFQVRYNYTSPCYLNITSFTNSQYLSQILDYYSGTNHNANFRIVCSDNCIAVIYWPTAVASGCILTTNVMIITTDNHGEVCAFYNKGAVYNSSFSIYPGSLATLTKDGDTTSAQYRVVDISFNEGASSTSVQAPAIRQTMLSNLPVWNNSQNDIKYMPHVFMASCVDQLTNTGSIVTVGDHEYYCCLMSRIFFD